MKTCTKCNEQKSIEEFHRDRRKPDGHLAQCKPCRAETNKRWWKANPEYDKARYWSDPESHRERHLIRKYGVDLAAYEKMLSNQKGKCAICGKEQERAFDVDHDHKTGRVRGLLCSNCNRMLGHAQDNPQKLIAASKYLELSSLGQHENS